MPQLTICPNGASPRAEQTAQIRTCIPRATMRACRPETEPLADDVRAATRADRPVAHRLVLTFRGYRVKPEDQHDRRHEHERHREEEEQQARRMADMLPGRRIHEPPARNFCFAVEERVRRDVLLVQRFCRMSSDCAKRSARPPPPATVRTERMIPLMLRKLLRSSRWTMKRVSATGFKGFPPPHRHRLPASRSRR